MAGFRDGRRTGLFGNDPKTSGCRTTMDFNRANYPYLTVCNRGVAVDSVLPAPGTCGLFGWTRPQWGVPPGDRTAFGSAGSKCHRQPSGFPRSPSLMSEWRRTSTAAQLAAWLREEIEKGRWAGVIPGVIRLSAELGVSRDSVEAALIELERDGVLLAQGRGKRRIIVAGEVSTGHSEK